MSNERKSGVGCELTEQQLDLVTGGCDYPSADALRKGFKLAFVDNPVAKAEKAVLLTVGFGFGLVGGLIADGVGTITNACGLSDIKESATGQIFDKWKETVLN